MKLSGVRKVPLNKAVLNRDKEPREKKDHFSPWGSVFLFACPPLFWRDSAFNRPIVFP